MLGHKKASLGASLVVGPSWRDRSIPLGHKLVGRRALVGVVVGHNKLEHMMDDKLGQASLVVGPS